MSEVEQVKSPLKRHGGKYYMLPSLRRIQARIGVDIKHRVEAFAGSCAWTLDQERVEGVSEVVNDLDGELTNFWSVLAHPTLFAKMQRILEATPCSEAVYSHAELMTAKRKELWVDRVPAGVDRVSRAVDFFIMCRQSRAATFRGFTPLAKTRTRRGMNELPSAWWAAIAGMPEIHSRLARVVILNRPAVKAIQSEDTPNTLIYADPPYLHSTRATTDAYEHEMSTEQHVELLDTLKQCKGLVMLSGYANDIYDSALKDWTRDEVELPNNAAGGKSKRRMVEVVWSNF